MRRWRGRGSARIWASSLAFGVVAIAGGHALASFTMSGVNPFYLEKRWPSPAALAERSEPVVPYPTIETDFAVSAGSGQLFGAPPPTAFAQPRAEQAAAENDDWQEPDLKPFAAEPAPRERFPIDEPSAAQPTGRPIAGGVLPADLPAEETTQPGQSGVTIKHHTDGGRGAPSIVEAGSEITEQ